MHNCCTRLRQAHCTSCIKLHSLLPPAAFSHSPFIFAPAVSLHPIHTRMYAIRYHTVAAHVPSPSPSLALSSFQTINTPASSAAAAHAAFARWTRSPRPASCSPMSGASVEDPWRVWCGNMPHYMTSADVVSWLEGRGLPRPQGVSVKRSQGLSADEERFFIVFVAANCCFGKGTTHTCCKHQLRAVGGGPTTRCQHRALVLARGPPRTRCQNIVGDLNSGEVVRHRLPHGGGRDAAAALQGRALAERAPPWTEARMHMSVFFI